MTPEPLPPTQPSRARLRVALPALVVVAAAFWVGLRMDGSRSDTGDTTADAPLNESASPLVSPLAGLLESTRIATLDGRTLSLTDAREPTVVMVSSTSCGFCKQALADLGEMSGGRAVPHLRVLTLEGAGDGAPMLASAGVRGAVLVGPASNGDRVMLTFQTPGTPVFALLDARGRVQRVVPGYLGRAWLARWLPVLTGERAEPEPVPSRAG